MMVTVSDDVARPRSESSPVQLPHRTVERRGISRVWLALLAWTLIWSVAEAFGGLYSWHYFFTAGQALSHPAMAGGGLHVYAAHPDLQMGPLTLVAAAVLVAVSGPLTTAMAALTMTGLGALNLWLLVSLRAHQRNESISPRTTLYAGLVLIPLWSVLSVHYGHLDDVLALTLTTLAVWALQRDHQWAVVLLLAAATAAKPWALPFAVLLLIDPVARTKRIGTYLALCVLPWMPFLIADTHTLRITSFTILNAPDSVLRAVGVATSNTPPWDRPAQLVLAVALGLWCLRINRPFAVPAVALTVRLLLDPGTYSYYTAGLLLACLYVDLTRSRRQVPWTAAAVFTWFALDGIAHGVLPAAVLGGVRAIFLVVLLLTLCAGWPSGWTRRARETHPHQWWQPQPQPHRTPARSTPAPDTTAQTAEGRTSPLPVRWDKRPSAR